MRSRAAVVFADTLESRCLLSAVYPTPYEQYMVELYNAARANPNAIALRYGVALNEALAPGTITSDAKQPLAINPNLTDAARKFAQYMVDHDMFGHYVDGSTPQARDASAGYSFTGSWGSGENIALVSSTGSLEPISVLDSQFRNYYVDSNISDRGHRVNMFSPNWKEIGSGQGTGPYNGMNAIITTQDFAYSATGSFLAGVAYTDLNHNNFYTPGEQMAGVTIAAIRISDNTTFTTTTWASGGYSLKLPAGTYTVWGSGGTLGSGFVKYDNVVIGTLNVKRDFRPDYVNSPTGPNGEPPPPPPGAFAQLSGGKLTINGSNLADAISVTLANGLVSATENRKTYAFKASEVTSIWIYASDGNDTVSIGSGVIGTTVYGGLGNDSIVGGDGNDALKGDAGNDTIFGGAGGNENIYGGDGDDSLSGGIGSDKIWGGNGNDKILGGSHNDWLFGEGGNDSLWGQNGNDFLDGGVGADWISGGNNVDTVDYSARTAALFVELAGLSYQAIGRSGEAGENDNVLTDVENINGGSGNDRLSGSALNNVIRGNAGNDSIYGMAGADSLYGGDGNDRLFAVDSAADQLDGGNGTDTASVDQIDQLINVESH